MITKRKETRFRDTMSTKCERMWSNTMVNGKMKSPSVLHRQTSENYPINVLTIKDFNTNLAIKKINLS